MIIKIILKLYNAIITVLSTLFNSIKYLSLLFFRITSVETSGSKIIDLEPATHLTQDIISWRMLWIILYWIYFVIYESGFSDTVLWVYNNSSMSSRGYSSSQNDIAELNKSYGTTLFQYKINWKDILWWYLMPLIY